MSCVNLQSHTLLILNSLPVPQGMKSEYPLGTFSKAALYQNENELCELTITHSSDPHSLPVPQGIKSEYPLGTFSM